MADLEVEGEGDGSTNPLLVGSAEESSMLQEGLRAMAESERSHAMSEIDHGSIDGQSSAGGGQILPLPAAEDNELPPEVTVRGMVIATLVGGIVGAQNIYFSFKLGWTMGVSLTSSILGFAMLHGLSKWQLFLVLPGMKNMFERPFTVQENCCMQTAASAAASMCQGSGLTVGLFSLSTQFQRYPGYINDTFASPETTPERTFDMSWTDQLVWCYGVLMFGFFVAIPLRRLLIEDYQLVFPSGTATAYVISAVHASKEGSKEGLRQFWLLMYTSLPAAVWYITKTCLFSGLDTIRDTVAPIAH